MSETLDRHVIDEAAQLLEQPGVWTRGTYDHDGHMCLIGAVLRPNCQPGDNHMWRTWLNRNGLDEEWNDILAIDATEVVTRLRTLPDPTEGDMAYMYGPQWRAIRDLRRRAAVLTTDEVVRLNAHAPLLSNAWGAPREKAWYEAQQAARGASSGHQSGWYDAGEAYEVPAVSFALAALAVRDLIGQHGFTQADYDLLTAPWAAVIGKVHPDDAGRLVVDQ